MSCLVGYALVMVAGLGAEICRADEVTTNAFALTMHSVIVPEIHIVSPEERGASASSADPFSFYPDVRCEGKAACSNQYSIALHARNLTMLELVDLICFLSETPYAFEGNRLVIAPTNGPAVELKQSARKEQALVAKLKAITIPEVTFRPPATIIDAMDFFYQASADYDDPEIHVKQRGISFAVKNPALLMCKPRPEDNLPVISAKEAPEGEGPIISALSARFCSLYEAVSNVCEKVDARFMIRDNTVVIYPARESNAPPGSGRTKTRNAE